MNQKTEPKYKPMWGLVEFKALEPMVKALEDGAKKYRPDDWKKAYTQDELKDKMMRHLAAIMDGQEIDEDSGLPHIGHLMADAMFYSYFLTVKEGFLNSCGCLIKLDFNGGSFWKMIEDLKKNNNESLAADKEMD